MALQIRQARRAMHDGLYVYAYGCMVATIVDYDGVRNLALVATIYSELWMSLRDLSPSRELEAVQC